MAFWLLVLSGAIGAGLGLAASALLARSILKPLSSLESAALAVADGDLEARAPATGPRELARLGASLNRMTESLLDASKLRELVEERDQAYIRLRDSEERLQDFLDNATDLIQSVAPDGSFVYVNRAWRETLGYSEEEIRSRNLFDIIHPDSKAHCMEMFQRVMAGETLEHIEATFVTKDGRSIWVEGNANCRFEDGMPVATRGIFRDVTEHKQAEEALRLQSQIMANMAEAVYLIRASDGVIVYTNPAFEKLFGYDPGEMVGKHVSIVNAPTEKDSEETAKEIIATLDSTGVWRGEILNIKKDGTPFWCYANVSTFDHPEHGRVWVTYHADITQRKRADEELRRLNQQLKELNRSLEARVKERTEDLRLANEELREGNRQLLDARAQAASDPLTGLSNHRTFHERIREEARRAQETGSPVGLIMMDIDDFKRVNDSQGHQAGDEILRDLTSCLADDVGEEKAYRYGGDEFAVLLSGVDRRKTARVAERLRRAVEKRTDGSGERVTVSLGVASFPDVAVSADELIYGADAAMYWAKSAGKNRVGDWGDLIKHMRDGSLPWYAADRGVKAPDAVAALSAALAAKDPTTAAHTERCSWYTAKLADELGLAEEEKSIVRLASLLHDIGKLAVPDEVLFKPGPLNEEEWAQMKQHSTAALHVLSHIRSLTDATPAILHHHEHFDGSGYPDGLAGEQIPIASRILLVTDSFDAMTTDRPYRKAMPVEAAIEELKRNSSSQFDPLVVGAFLRMLAREGAQPLRRKAATRARPVAAAASGSYQTER